MKIILYAVLDRTGKLKAGTAVYKRKGDAIRFAKSPGDSVVEAVVDLEANPLHIKGKVLVDGEWVDP